MPIDVIKFGGTSVASVQRIKQSALIIQQHLQRKKNVVVVVSAMSGMTDQLLRYAHELCTAPTPEHHSIAASGEQISSGLMALALKQLGIPSTSLQGFQLPILTTYRGHEAHIADLDVRSILDLLNQNITPVVSGFQGITYDIFGETLPSITTLGRGGSDTTAVALAAQLNADKCYIYTDVKGVYTSDPRLIRNAQLIDEISYGDAIMMAANGAKVLHERCVHMAERYKVCLEVLSSFEDSKGTIITLSETPLMEQPQVIAITHALDRILVTLHTSSSHNAAWLSTFLSHVSASAVTLSHFTHNTFSGDDRTTTTFTIHRDHQTLISSFLQEIDPPLHFAIDDSIAIVTLVGRNINSTPMIQDIYRQFIDNQVSIFMIDAASSGVSIAIPNTHLTKAVSFLHAHFFETAA